MTFYLKPPDGIIPNHLYQLYAESRLKFLLILNNNKLKSISTVLQENALNIPRLDSLIEGSIKDRVSHFALRSCVIQDSNMHHFVLYGERLLFQARLKEASANDLERGIRHLIQHLKLYIPFLSQMLNEVQTRKYTEYFQVAISTLAEILKQKLLLCLPGYAIDTSITTCKRHGATPVISVPFQQVLKLTSKLAVPLKDGLAYLQCHQIPDYLTELFTNLLKVSSETMEKTECIQRIRLDPRLTEISNELKRVFHSQGYYLPLTSESRFIEPVYLISLEQTALKYFPPCMSNLYKSLRRHHRLCHQPRVQLTLFLKSIGLRIDDCLRLIQDEYTKPTKKSHDNEHKCEHFWHKDSRRYIYGTRHLYGLEGARKNYSSHNCQAVQSNTNSSSCGGCPFAQDEKRRTKILTADLGNQTAANEFIACTKEENLAPIEACHKYLCFKLKQQTTGESKNQTAAEDGSMNVICNTNKERAYIYMISKPIDFYMRMKHLSIESHKSE